MGDPRAVAATAPFPPWLLSSKVHPTRHAVEVLERGALLRRLDACLSATLTIVHAPGGYGKSTLVSAWREQLLARGCRVCWLSLDAEDNDAFQLLSYIAFALHAGGVPLPGGTDPDASAFVSELSPRNLLNILLRSIDEAGANVVLVLDDFENLGREAIQAAIDPLLRHAPRNLHLCIATRSDTLLETASLEIRGEATRLGAVDLAFTLEDLERHFAGQLESATIRRVFDATEGWPVAVQVLRGALATMRDVERVLANFHGETATIAAYLSEEVFADLAAEQQAFLLDVALLGRFDCDFADHLRESNDSRALIASLQRLRALLQPLDALDETWRLHPLLADFLRHRLVLQDPARVALLHARTAAWFEARGDLVAAVRHWIAAGNADAAVRAVEDAGALVLWLREGLGRLRNAVSQLEAANARFTPRIDLVRCLLEMKDGRIHRAEELFAGVTRAQRALQGEGAGAALAYEITILGPVLAVYAGRQVPEEYCAELIENTRRIDPSDHITLVHHYTLLCIIHTQGGQYAGALRYAHDALREGRLINSAYTEAYIHFHLGDIHFAQGESEAAEREYRFGIELARRRFNDDKGMQMAGQVLYLELAYELGRMRQLPHALRAIPRQLEEREAWFDIYAAGYLTASKLELANFGLEPALRLLDRAAEYAQAQRLRPLADLLTWQRIELLVSAGEIAQARAVLDASAPGIERYRGSAGSDVAWRERDAAIHATTRLMLREGRLEPALELLREFALLAQSSGHARSCIRYALLQALGEAARGAVAPADAHLEEALERSRRSGFVQCFVDEGEELRALLESWLQRRGTLASDALAAQARTVLAAFGPAAEPARPAVQLSPREREVLVHLARGESNKHIARRMDVSENTVRFHLKNVFAKLAVDSRTGAVAAAMERKLIG